MKLNKILAIALAAVTMTACSDDDSWNSASDVTVSMAQAAIEAPEDFTGTFYYIPLKLSGEANGPVKVTVAMEETSANPAIETAHYFVTSKTVTFPKGVTEVSVEFHPTGNTDINEDRQFVAKITNVEGATVEGLDQTVVTLLDDDRYLPEAYAKIQGQYLLNAKDSRGNPVQAVMNVIGLDENEEGYLSKLYVTGFGNYAGASAEATFTYDAANKVGMLSLSYGQYVLTNEGFDDLGNCDVMLASVSSSNTLLDSGRCTLTATSDYSALIVPGNAAWVGALFSSDSGSFTGYVWFWYVDMTLTRQ